MGHEREIQALMLEDHVYPLDWASDFSAEICVTAKSDTIAPVAPSSVAATAKLERIQVSWTNPTENADGTPCTDLLRVNVYYASKATHDAQGSIDISNSDTYDGIHHVSSEEWPHNVDAGAQYYYVVTSVDRTENEGVASSEVNATALTVGDSTNIPDDATGLIFDDVAIGDGILVVVTHVPTTTWVGFSHYRLWYSVKNGSWGSWVEIGPIGRYGYTHKNLDKAKVYKYKATIVGEGTDNESSTADTIDNGGAGFQPDAADNSAIGAILIAAQTIVGTREVRAPNITCDNLAAINADLGAVTAGSIVVGTTNKIWLNEGADGILAIGGATKASAPFRVSAVGAVVMTSAVVACGAGSSYAGNSIAKAYTEADVTSEHDCQHPGDYTATIINGGLITTGTISFNDGSVTKAGMTATGSGDTNVRIWAGDTYANRATADFRVLQNGKCYATAFETLTPSGGGPPIVTGGVYQGAWIFIKSVTDDNVATNLSLTADDLGTWDRLMILYEVHNQEAWDEPIYMRLNNVALQNYTYMWQDGTGSGVLDATEFYCGKVDSQRDMAGTIYVESNHQVTEAAAPSPSAWWAGGGVQVHNNGGGWYKADIYPITRIDIFGAAGDDDMTGYIAVYGMNYP